MSTIVPPLKPPADDPVIISFPRLKGGVGVTPMAIDSATTLARAGYNVLLVDASPQCNATASVFASDDEKDGMTLTRVPAKYNISSAMRLLMKGWTPSLVADIVRVRDYAADAPSSLFMITGDFDAVRGFSAFESKMLRDCTTPDATGSYQTLGGMYHVFRATARQHKIQFIVVDLSCENSIINRLFTMVSTFIICPFENSYFSLMSVKLLAKNLPKWDDWMQWCAVKGQGKTTTTPRQAKPILLGWSFKHSSAAPHERQYEDRIRQEIRSCLIPSLFARGMSLPADAYTGDIDSCKIVDAIRRWTTASQVTRRDVMSKQHCALLLQRRNMSLPSSWQETCKQAVQMYQLLHGKKSK